MQKEKDKCNADIKLFLVMCKSEVEWSNYSIDPPLGLIALASYVTSKNILTKDQIFICDLNIKEGENYYNKSKHDKIDNQGENTILGFSVNLFNIENSFKEAQEIKEKLPNATVVFGGQYVSTYINEYKKGNNYEYIDCFIPYHGEIALYEIISLLKKGNKVINNKIIEGTIRPVIDYPYDYSLMEYLAAYQKINDIKIFNDDPYLHIPYISRFGCPYRTKYYKNKKWCGFCSLMDEEIGERNEKNVLSEVKQAIVLLVKLYKKNDKEVKILLRDVSDFPNPKLAGDLKKNLKEKICKEGLIADIKVLVYQRADYINEENIKNFDIIFLGTESGSDNILMDCNKGLTVNDIKKAYDIIKKSGKKIITSFILGLKGEDYNSIKETKNFINQNIDRESFIAAGVNIYLPFPGAPFFDEMIEKIDDWKIDGIKDLKELQRTWIKNFTKLNCYEIIVSKMELERLIKERLAMENQYFDFGLDKRVVHQEEIKSPKLIELFNKYFDHIIALAESENIENNFWGTISIREILLKKIYNIDTGILNTWFFIGENNSQFDEQHKRFSKLNNFCFSSKNSFLNFRILKNELPTVSDILPVLNKSLILLKDSQNNWSNLNELFDYSETINNCKDDGEIIENLISNNDDDKKYETIISYSKIKKYRIIETIANDYTNYINSSNKPAYKKAQIIEAFQYIFAMYNVHLSLGYDIFIYYPIKIADKSEIAFTLGLKFENFKNIDHFKTFFIKYLKILNSIIFKKLFGDISEENIKNSLKFAVAAIMARNMSHNIGSHVLSYLKDVYNIPDTTPEQSEIYKEFNSSSDKLVKIRCFLKNSKMLLEYLKERMDFIATILTYIPPSSILNFKADIINQINFDLSDDNSTSRFTDPKNLILEFIGFSERIKGKTNVKRENIKIKFKDFEFTHTKKNNNNGEKTSEELCKKLNIAIPGGIVGRQAFFTILENIIRNAAKHAAQDMQNDELIFTIDTPDPSPQKKEEKK